MNDRPKDPKTLTTADLADTDERESQRRAAFQPPETRRADGADDERRERERVTDRESDGVVSHPPPRAAVGDEGSASPLLEPGDVKDLRGRWDSIQSRFVDEPRIAVQEADGLVAATIQQLAQSFAKQRADLEHQWSTGNDVSTEDLRLALRRYRSFFQRLLAA